MLAELPDGIQHVINIIEPTHSVILGTGREHWPYTGLVRRFGLRKKSAGIGDLEQAVKFKVTGGKWIFTVALDGALQIGSGKIVVRQGVTELFRIG